MTATSVSSVIPVTNMTAAVERWEQLLGLPPTFVDGDRWAQFDVGGRGSLWRAPTGPPKPPG
ncbi:MAG: hypothetical protein VYB10_05230 [Actinomycetota bacterium]|nr:hypothetical protein [Actinomycetota bacterium]